MASLGKGKMVMNMNRLIVVRRAPVDDERGRQATSVLRRPADRPGGRHWRRGRSRDRVARRAAGGIFLKRWDAGSCRSLPDARLFSGPHILQFPSADSRHLLVAERANPGDFIEYEWTIFALETGSRAGAKEP